MSGKQLRSLTGIACELQVSRSWVSGVVGLLGLEPALVLDERAFFDEWAVGRIRRHIEQTHETETANNGEQDNR